MGNRLRILFLIITLVLAGLTLNGCQFSLEIPAGSHTGVTETAYFEHFWLSRNTVPGPQNAVGPLIVVIEGDGSPFLNRYQVSLDPTPNHPVLLNWIGFTQHDVLYLGRPCYFGKSQILPPEPPGRVTGQLVNRRCDSYWYTLGRYSEPVVTSMVQALNNLHKSQCIILLGHSGGAALSMLMAEQMPGVVAIVTLAGNLNVGKWQAHHQYTPLIGSLDPATSPVLHRRIMQVHIAAQQDQIILADWIYAESERQQGEYQIWNAPAHSDWQSLWPDLDKLMKKLFQELTCSTF